VPESEGSGADRGHQPAEAESDGRRRRKEEEQCGIPIMDDDVDEKESGERSARPAVPTACRLRLNPRAGCHQGANHPIHTSTPHPFNTQMHREMIFNSQRLSFCMQNHCSARIQ
jgi:hypothetical protein